MCEPNTSIECNEALSEERFKRTIYKVLAKNKFKTLV